MQSKSEMINRIAELAEENAELKAENARLKEEIKEYKKHSKCAWKCFEGTLCVEGEKYKQTLQEIKEYAESIGNEKMINGYAIRAKSALWRIAQKITKAEV